MERGEEGAQSAYQQVSSQRSWSSPTTSLWPGISPFRKRFTEMAGISLGVAGFSFVIGYMIRIGPGVEV